MDEIIRYIVPLLIIVAVAGVAYMLIKLLVKRGVISDSFGGFIVIIGAIVIYGLYLS